MSSAPRDIELEAHEAWESGDCLLAFKLFSEGAALGLNSCMLDLGYFYDEGIGTKQDKAQAMSWYKKAYRKGSSAAASNVAILYKEQNRYRLVFQWFRRATALGDGDAEVDLAKLYIHGKGVRRSLEKAKQHLLSALSPTASITEAGQEEATELLRKVENGT